jgi:predicted CXXCH cytochrome family protein
MKLLVISVTRNRKGNPLRAERTLEGATIRLGRGAQCEIHLPDRRVALNHATIYQQGDDFFIGATDAELSIDGTRGRVARLVPGVRVEVGPYELTVESRPDLCDVALAVELVRPLPDDLAGIRAKSRLSLAATGLSKRTPAWTLAIVIAVLFLALPVMNALDPKLRQQTSSLPLTPDQSWNPGDLAEGHQVVGRRCAVCHETPFVRVRDSACIRCHQHTPGHVQTVALQQQLFGDTRCASCHADHKGPHGLVRMDAQLCTSCHRDLKHSQPDTSLANAVDFAADHPGFKLTLSRGPGKEETVRIAQSDKAQLFERSHLKFPHDEHLRPGVRGPKGRKALACRSCHLPDDSGKGFEPINMKKSCIECHRLEFEPAVTKRQVPHGSVDDVYQTMQEFYANIALNDIPVDVKEIGVIRYGLPRLGNEAITDEQRQRALAWAKAKAAQVAQDLFEARVCIVCHEVGRNLKGGPTRRGPAWDVAPVRIASTWFPKARFDHAKHRTYACADCHDVENSRDSHDIAIPDIATCRKCHAGSEGAANRVVSTCVACHGFHLPGHPPFGQASARAAARPAGPTVTAPIRGSR